MTSCLARIRTCAAACCVAVSACMTWTPACAHGSSVELVMVESAALREAPAAFSAALHLLPYGTVVERVGRRAAWVEVITLGAANRTLRGWLKAGELAPFTPAIESGGSRPVANTSRRPVSLAGKGLLGSHGLDGKQWPPSDLIHDDEKATRYLSALGEALAAVGGSRAVGARGYRFAILDSDRVNAYAMPVASVFVTRGLLRVCASEEELAAVLAHEIAHTNAWLTPGADAREAELQADAAAVALLERARYPAGALRVLLARLSRLDDEPRRLSRSHPALVARLRALPVAAVPVRSVPARQRRFEHALRDVRG